MSRLRDQSVAVCLAGVLLCASQAGAQAAGNWNTARGDAAHEGWQKVETELSPDSIAGKFKFLWKIKLGDEEKATNSFSEPLLIGRLINAHGFKDLVLWADTDTLYAVDSELGSLEWKKRFDVASSTSPCGASNLGIVIEAPRVINFRARPRPGTPRPAPQPPAAPSARRLGT